MEVTEIRERLTQSQRLSRFYEPDTTERLVVPVLSILGWDVDTLTPPQLIRGNRDNRSASRLFDVQLHVSGSHCPAVVLECKSLGDQIVVQGRAASDNSHKKAFARELRNNCLSEDYSFRQGYTVPVLTNGRQWYLFTDKFVDPRHQNEEITDRNWDDYVLVETTVEEEQFISSLQPYLTYSTAEQKHGEIQPDPRKRGSS